MRVERHTLLSACLTGSPIRLFRRLIYGKAIKMSSIRLPFAIRDDTPLAITHKSRNQ